MWVQREAELRSSMFSSLYWSIWAWNVHNTPQTPANDPAKTSDCNILVRRPDLPLAPAMSTAE